MKSKRPRPREALLSIALYAVVIGVLYFLVHNEPSSALVEYLAVSAVFAVSIGGPAWLIMPLAAPGLWRFPPLWKWTALTGTMLAIVTAGCLLACALLVWLGLGPASNFWGFYWGSLRVALLLGMIGGVGSAVYETMRVRMEKTELELQTKELERQKAWNAATTARLASLESRVHPHFLFNALNSISSLIPDDPRAAERLVERMAALLRFSLDSGQGGLVELEREMKIVRDYLEIEQVRFAGRLRYTLDVAGECKGYWVPPLSIQTLVENSVKYAVAKRREGGEVAVKAHCAGDRLAVEVGDDGPGFTPENYLAGHGLDNLNERLRALYGEGNELRMERREGRMMVGFEAPMRSKA